MSPRTLDPKARFFSKVVVSDGCWYWTGCLMPNGYGKIGRGGRGAGTALAHRFGYELLVGPIPEGLHLDHLCRNRWCVNPEHLEPVTNRTNLLRGQGPSAVNARKTHCQNGHEFNATNRSARSDGKRTCLVCRRLNRAAKKARVDA